MKIVIGGSHQIACNALLHLIELGIDKHNLLVCESKRDNSENTWQRSLIYFAKKLDILIVSLDQLYDVENLIFFSLEFDQIIKIKKFKSARFYNIHFSLLPKYKGMYTSCLPLLNGDTESGVTLHKIDEGIDTGEIIDQLSFPIPLEMNSFALFNQYHHHAFELFRLNVVGILEGKALSYPQSSDNSTYFSKKAIDFSKIEIDFKQTAFQVHNYIRAFSFRPYQLPQLGDFRISHSQITTRRSNSKPGEYEQVSSKKRIFSTIDFDLEVYMDQLDGILESASENDLPTLKELAKEGYDLMEKNSLGWDALIVSAYNNSHEVLDFLLKEGANPNSINNNGTSVLMYAITNASQSGDLKNMDCLIEAGANIGHQDYKGISLSNYADKYGNKDVIQFVNSFL